MIIAIAHSKGGVGKSTTAFNIAVALQKKFDVTLVDLDFQRSVTYTNSVRKKYGVKPLDVVSFSNVSEYKKYVQEDSDQKISIVDVGGFDSDLNRLVILTSDIVITPVSESGRELHGIKRFHSILEDMSKKMGRIITVHVLLNNINPNKIKLGGLKKFISKSENFILLESILRSRVDFDYSMDEGKGVIEYNKKGKAAIEMKDLVKELKLLIEEIV